MPAEVTSFDIEKIRNDFPILSREVNGSPLVYFDNGATAQKPKALIDSINRYYQKQNSNIHRGVHHLSQEATYAYESAREKIANYIGAEQKEEIIFTKGTTDAINLIAFSYGEAFIQKGDEVLISEMEHHSNIVPWQLMCERKGAILKVIPVLDDGSLDMLAFDQLLNSKTKLLALVHFSNTLGTINPIKSMIAKAKANSTHTLIDGAQAVPHQKINVQDLDCDCYVFSMHKLFGPTGLGVLYGKKELLDQLPPYQGGGDMIKTVSFAKTTYNELPHKFEAGTPNIAAGIACGELIDYLNKLDWDAIAIHENSLLDYATEAVKSIAGLKVIGTSKNKASVLSFVIDGAHHYDLGVILDQQGIAVRTGHHCTQPLMARFGIDGTVRASFSFYNSHQEIDLFIKALRRAIKMVSA